MLKYILALIILAVIIAGYSVWSFNLKAGSDIEALFLEANTNSMVITEKMLYDLPAPVHMICLRLCSGGLSTVVLWAEKKFKLFT
jgi:hypothetical protein